MTVNILAATILVSIVFAVFYYLSRRTSDPYGTFHIPFNRVPGGPDPPQTEWLNMGFWKVRYVTTIPSSFIHSTTVGHINLPGSVPRCQCCGSPLRKAYSQLCSSGSSIISRS